MRLENEKELLLSSNDQNRKESSYEVGERLARHTRILNDRNGMEPTMRRQFDQIDEFRGNVRGFK